MATLLHRHFELLTTQLSRHFESFFKIYKSIEEKGSFLPFSEDIWQIQVDWSDCRRANDRIRRVLWHKLYNKICKYTYL